VNAIGFLILFLPSFIILCPYTEIMPSRLKRYYGNEHLHFLTCTCYHRQRWLGSARRRDLFLRMLEQARQRYRFVVVGYVVMPEHIHLLISEPEQGTPSTVMQVLKQRFARRVLARKRRSSAQAELWPQQRVEHAQARGEAALHASESCKKRTSVGTRTVGVEQLSQLCLWGRG
jgi:REP element-mobilizing transposase RayT